MLEGNVPGMEGPGGGSSRGTFNAAAIQALQGSNSPAERTAKNTEKIYDVLKEMSDEAGVNIFG